MAEALGWTVVSVIDTPFSHVEHTGEGVGLQIVTGINERRGECDRLGSAQEFGYCLREMWALIPE